jgi:hypothetical protein
VLVRKVPLWLKPNAAADFATRLEDDGIPQLGKQKRFQEEITFTSRDGIEAMGISFWDRKESHEADDRTSWLQVVKMLDSVTSDPPRVETNEVFNSTFHRTLAPAEACRRRTG